MQGLSKSIYYYVILVTKGRPIDKFMGVHILCICRIL